VVTIVAPHRHGSTTTVGRITIADEREQLPELCERTSIALESLRTQWRTVANLGTHERMAISQLRVYGSMPMSELAARISLSRAAVTSLVDRLEADGWVRRIPDEEDRRRTVLRLLPRADEAFDEVTEPYHVELRELARSMSDEQLATVSEFLDRVGEIANRQAGDLRRSAPERALG
jgi:DNA-binding MarR family transcriptional regulator